MVYYLLHEHKRTKLHSTILLHKRVNPLFTTLYIINYVFECNFLYIKKAPVLRIILGTRAEASCYHPIFHIHHCIWLYKYVSNLIIPCHYNGWYRCSLDKWSFGAMLQGHFRFNSLCFLSPSENSLYKILKGTLLFIAFLYYNILNYIFKFIQILYNITFSFNILKV